MPMLDLMAHSGTARTAAFFDLDKTIIARSSTLAFSRPFYAGGLINRRTVLRSAYAQFVYLLGGADHDQMERMREYLSAMCTGWDVETVKDRRRHPAHIVTPMIHEEAVELIDEHHAAGRDVVIVSSGAEVVEPIGAMLGADKVIATRMVVADGKYTGEIEEYAYGRTRRPRCWPWPRPRATTWRTPTPIRILSPTSRCWLRWVTLRGQPGQGVTPARGRRDWPVLDFSEPVGLAERGRLRGTTACRGHRGRRRTGRRGAVPGRPAAGPPHRKLTVEAGLAGRES